MNLFERFRLWLHARSLPRGGAGYAELAAGQDFARRQRVARRRPPSWADES